MSKDFEVTDCQDGTWGVSWDNGWVPIKSAVSFNKLFDIVFVQIKSWEAGFWMESKTRGGSVRSVNWIDQVAYNRHEPDGMIDWFAREYNIIGVKFHKQAEAEKFHDILEGKLTWYLLKEQNVQSN